MMSPRIYEVEYSKKRTERKFRDILIIHGGSMKKEEFLKEISKEGYDVDLLIPLLPRFSAIIIENDKVLLRDYQKRLRGSKA